MSMTAAQKRARELGALKAELADVVVKDDSETPAEEKQAKVAELEGKISELEAKVAEDVAKAEAKSAEAALAAQENTESASDAQRQGLARKKVDLDEDIKRVRPTFARGVQAVIRERMLAKGKK